MYKYDEDYHIQSDILETLADIKKILFHYSRDITQHLQLQDLKDHIKLAAQTRILEEISITID